MDILEGLDMQIWQCKQRYEANRENAFLSNVYGSELEQLCTFRDRLQAGESVEALLAAVKQRFPELKAQRAQEEAYPSFDWYGEHYQFEVLDGMCSAYETMLRILEQEI